MKIPGKVVLITGGARGIGAEVARQLVDQGASVAVLDHDVEAARRLVAELGGAAAAFDADVRSGESMTAACAAAAPVRGQNHPDRAGVPRRRPGHPRRLPRAGHRQRYPYSASNR